MKNYNMDALRGGSDTDEETRSILLDGRPNLNIPESTMNTSAFVPTIIREIEMAQRKELLSQINPVSNQRYTQTEAEQQANKSAKVAMQTYKELLSANR